MGGKGWDWSFRAQVQLFYFRDDYKRVTAARTIIDDLLSCKIERSLFRYRSIRLADYMLLCHSVDDLIPTPKRAIWMGQR